MSDVKLTNNNVIKSINYDQHEIIRDIIDLHMGGKGFEIDTTYSVGKFYKDKNGNEIIKDPERKFDMFPSIDGVEQLTFPLPFEDNSVRSIMFDPPFIIRSKPKTGENDNSIIHKRFSGYSNPKELFQSYRQNMEEYYRILEEGGILVIKTQAMISSAKQHFTPEWLVVAGYEMGFYPIDKFELLAKTRILSGHVKQQQHSRRFSSSFIVFKKCKPKVDYRSLWEKK